MLCAPGYYGRGNNRALLVCLEVINMTEIVIAFFADVRDYEGCTLNNQAVLKDCD